MELVMVGEGEEILGEEDDDSEAFDYGMSLALLRG